MNHLTKQKEKFKRRYSHESAVSEDESKKQKFRCRYSHDSQNHESASESKKQIFDFKLFIFIF